MTDQTDRENSYLPISKFMGRWSHEEPESWERFEIVLLGHEAGDVTAGIVQTREVLAASGFKLMLVQDIEQTDRKAVMRRYDSAPPFLQAKVRAMLGMTKPPQSPDAGKPFVKVSKEPSGLDYIENCQSCRVPTRYWANNGEFPLCQACADAMNGISPFHNVGPVSPDKRKAAQDALDVIASNARGMGE